MPPPSPLIVMAAMARKSEAQKQRSSLFFSNHRDKQNYYDNLPHHFNEEESDTESEDSDDFRKQNHSHQALSAQQQQQQHDQKHGVVQADDQKREHNEQRHRSSSKVSLNDGGGARHNNAHLHVLPFGLNQSRGNSRESTRPSYDHYRHQQPATKGVDNKNYNDNRTDEDDYSDINIEEKHKHEDDPRPLLIDAEKINRDKLATIHLRRADSNPRPLHEQHQPRSNDHGNSHSGTTARKDSIIVANHSHMMTRPQLPSTRPRASLHELRLARGGNGNSNSGGGERRISQSKEITRWGGSDASPIVPQDTRGRLFHAGGGHTYLDEEVAIGAKAHLPPRRNVTASSSSLSYRYEPSYVVHCDPNRREETGEEEYMREGENGAEEEETNDTHNNNEANRSVDGPPPVPRASPPTQTPQPTAQFSKIIPPSVTSVTERSSGMVSFGRAESLSPFIGGPSPSPYRSSLRPASSPNVVLSSKVHFSTPRQRHQQKALMGRDEEEEEKEKKVSYESSDEDTYVIHEGRGIGSENGSRLMFPSPNHREAGLPTSGTNHTSQGANHTGMKSKDVLRNPLLDITKATANGLNTLVALMLKREYTKEYSNTNTMGTKRNSQQVSTINNSSSETVGLSEKEKTTETDEVVHKKNEDEDKNTEHKSKETQQKGFASKNGNILVPANVASSSSNIRAKKKGGSAPRQVRRSASSSSSVSRGRLYFGWSLLGVRARSLPPRSLDPHEGKSSESYEIREEEKRGVIHSYMYHGRNDGTVAMEQMRLQVRQRNGGVQTNFADAERTSLAVLNHSDSVSPQTKYISGKGHQEEGLSSSDPSLRCDVMGKALQHVISENHRLDAGACVAERMFTERAAELQNVYDHSIRSIREELLSFPTASAGLSTRRVVDASTNTIMVDYYHGDINKDATSLLLALSNKEKAEDRGVQCEAEKETLHDKLPSPVSRINKATQSDSDATESKGVQTDYYPSPEEVAERCARLADAEKEAIRFAFAESEVAKDKEREEAVASALRLLQTLRRQHEEQLALLVEKHNVEVNALHIERNGRALRIEQLSAEITSLRLREEVVIREWAQKLEMCERAKARAISEMETVHEQKVSELVLAHSAMLQSEREAFGAATERLRAEADAFASAVLASTAGVVQEETAPVEPPLVSSSSFLAPIGASLPQFFELFAERFTIQNEWVNTVGTIMSEFQELKGLVMMTAVLEDHKAEKELLVAHFTRESEKAKESVREGALASLEEALKRQKDELLAERSRSEEAIRLSYAEEVGRLSKLAALYQHEREQASEELKAIQSVLQKERKMREEERQETLKSERELRLRVEEAESRARIAQNAVEEARSSNAVERQRLLMTHTNQVFILEEQLAVLKRAQWSSALVTGNERREKSYLVSNATEGAHHNPMRSTTNTTNAAPVTAVGDGEEHEEAPMIGQVIELSNVNTPAASPQPVPPPNNRKAQQQRQEDVNATTNPTTPEAAPVRSGLYGGVGTLDDEDRHLTRWSSSPAEGKRRQTEYNAVDNDDDQATQIYKADEQKEVYYYDRTKSPPSRLPTVSQHFVSPMSNSTFSYRSSPLLSSPSFSSTTKTRDVEEERGREVSEVRTAVGSKHAYTGATASTDDERRDIRGKTSRSRSNRGTLSYNRGMADDERLVSSYRVSSHFGDDRMRTSPSLSPSMTVMASYGGGHINDNSPHRTQTTTLGVNNNNSGSGSAFTVSASPSHIRGNPFPLAGRRRVRHHAGDSTNNIINDHNNEIVVDGPYTRRTADAASQSARSPAGSSSVETRSSKKKEELVRLDVNNVNNRDLSLTTSRKIEYDEERDKDEGSNGLNGNEKGERRLFALGRQRPPRDEFEQHPYRRGVAVPLVFDTPPPLPEKVRIGRGDMEDVAHGADVHPSSFEALPSPLRTDLHRRLSKSPLKYSPTSGNNAGPSSSATSSPWSPHRNGGAERGKVTSSNSSSTRKGVGTDDTDASTNSFEVSFSQSPPQHQQVRSLLAYLTR